MEFEKLELFPGHDKNGIKEQFSPLTMKRGELYTIVGSTGSGKSRLIKDIEQLANGDSVTGRRVRLNGESLRGRQRLDASRSIVAHLAQNMRFVLDTSVGNFIKLHAGCRSKDISPTEVLSLANRLTPEPIFMEENLNLLSGGQARSLMIADIALICDSPIVLIDEIENAGLDKEEALRTLQSQDKLVLVVTHEIHTALMSSQRIVMRNGAILSIVSRTPAEQTLFQKLSQQYHEEQRLRCLLRAGMHLEALSS